jgi:hypothetical protein
MGERSKRKTAEPFKALACASAVVRFGEVANLGVSQLSSAEEEMAKRDSKPEASLKRTGLDEPCRRRAGCSSLH